LKAAELAAKDLEREKVDLIYAVGTSASRAVKQATTTVLVVFYAGTDPVTAELVESFRKPGGRFTGIYSGFTNLTAKRLELLKAMVPKIRRAVIFYESENLSAQMGVKVARDAARQLKVELLERPIASVEELRAGLRALRPAEVDAICAGMDAMVISQAAVIINTAKEKKLPAMFSEQESVAQGGLASYGESFTTIGQLSARYVQRILMGANPGDLPVERLDRLYFVINVKTAKTLGLTIPPSVLGRADQVIE
jgi:putative tryptophan/tyrosine transport system substrate-binding protein